MGDRVRLEIRVVPGGYAVWQLPPESKLPEIRDQVFLSVTRTAGEISVVSSSNSVPPGVPVEDGWSCLEVAGPLNFGLTGILASLTEPLATAEVPVFAISTFDTDFLLVKTENLDRARRALEGAGHKILRN